MVEENPFKNDKYAILDINPEKPLKPIDLLRQDIKEVKTELNHIKNYIRKLEIREALKEEKEKQTEAEYQHVKKGWIW